MEDSEVPANAETSNEEELKLEEETPKAKEHNDDEISDIKLEVDQTQEEDVGENIFEETPVDQVDKVSTFEMPVIADAESTDEQETKTETVEADSEEQDKREVSFIESNGKNIEEIVEGIRSKRKLDEISHEESKEEQPTHEVEDGKQYTRDSLEKYEEDTTKGHLIRGSHHRNIKKSKDSALKYSESTNDIDYDFGPRYGEEVDIMKSENFGVTSIDGLPMMKYYPYMDEDEEEGEEESSVEEEQEIETIDRDEYYRQYEHLQNQIAFAKIECNLYQRRLAVFFRRRKMDHVLRESHQQPFDTLQKYTQHLDDYETTKRNATIERNNVTDELDKLKEKREKKYAELQQLFIDMQEREKEIGYGLINTKTGNAIPDKLVERLINRQRMKMEQVSAMRLKYIILKGMVADKQQAIADIDNIGEGLRLRDYEQLKVENRSHADKIEERDEELTRLRFKCQNTIQIVAHIREKSSALDGDIEELSEDMRIAEMETQVAREKLNHLKQERDHTRMSIEKIRMESGLLAEPELLRDMENSMKELTHIKDELEYLRAENKEKAQHIRNIRKNIEIRSEEIIKAKSSKTPMEKPKSKPKIMRGRPSIFKPTLPINAYDYLREHKNNKNIYAVKQSSSKK